MKGVWEKGILRGRQEVTGSCIGLGARAEKEKRYPGNKTKKLPNNADKKQNSKENDI